jgi:DNA polymerase-3 subunit epsilon
MGFVAMDVETANADKASICQIGIARFANRVVIDEWKSYVDPKDYFHSRNVSIHGIKKADVDGAPSFGALVKEINGRLNGQVVVTHTNFDKVAIYQACKKWKAMPPSCTWLDSARVARRTWKEFSQRGYGLQNVCALIGYKFRAHDALEDAKAVGNVMLAATTQTGLDLDGWLARVRQPIDPTLKQRVGCEGSPDGAIYGEVLVFTGELTIPRREAANIAASVGCEVDEDITKRTTILVVGDQDISRLAGYEKSSKHRRAEELIRRGQAIRILRETDFDELVKLAREAPRRRNRSAQPGELTQA